MAFASYLSDNIPKPSHSFQVGFKLEAVHPFYPNFVSPATIVSVNDNDETFIVEIDDFRSINNNTTDQNYLPIRFLSHAGDARIMPPGMAHLRAIPLMPPNGWVNTTKTIATSSSSTISSSTSSSSSTTTTTAAAAFPWLNYLADCEERIRRSLNPHQICYLPSTKYFKWLDYRRSASENGRICPPVGSLVKAIPPPPAPTAAALASSSLTTTTNSSTLSLLSTSLSNSNNNFLEALVVRVVGSLLWLNFTNCRSNESFMYDAFTNCIQLPVERSHLGLSHTKSLNSLHPLPLTGIKTFSFQAPNQSHHHHHHSKNQLCFSSSSSFNNNNNNATTISSASPSSASLSSFTTAFVSPSSNNTSSTSTSSSSSRQRISLLIHSHRCYRGQKISEMHLRSLPNCIGPGVPEQVFYRLLQCMTRCFSVKNSIFSALSRWHAHMKLATRAQTSDWVQCPITWYAKGPPQKIWIYPILLPTSLDAAKIFSKRLCLLLHLCPGFITIHTKLNDFDEYTTATTTAAMDSEELSIRNACPYLCEQRLLGHTYADDRRFTLRQKGSLIYPLQIIGHGYDHLLDSCSSSSSESITSNASDSTTAIGISSRKYAQNRIIITRNRSAVASLANATATTAAATVEDSIKSSSTLIIEEGKKLKRSSAIKLNANPIKKSRVSQNNNNNNNRKSSSSIATNVVLLVKKEPMINGNHSNNNNHNHHPITATTTLTHSLPPPTEPPSRALFATLPPPPTSNSTHLLPTPPPLPLAAAPLPSRRDYHPLQHMFDQSYPMLKTNSHPKTWSTDMLIEFLVWHSAPSPICDWARREQLDGTSFMLLTRPLLQAFGMKEPYVEQLNKLIIGLRKAVLVS